MHIQRETPDDNAIRSYSNEKIIVGDTEYTSSIILSRQRIIASWDLYSAQDLNEKNLEPLLQLEPEIIIIGHQQAGIYIPITVMEYLSKRRIGIECMSIGSASRTFNVLLS